MGKKPLTEAMLISKKFRYGSLGKLKWFCEMCQYQARNEESFNSHVKSERHRRMMLHFRENSESIIRNNSNQFKKEFLSVLKTRYRDKEVLANTVYISVISNKYHQHMNSTRWISVRGFLEEIKQDGYIELKDTDNGPVIKYIEKDDFYKKPEELIAEREKFLEDEFNKSISNSREVLDMLHKVNKNSNEIKNIVPDVEAEKIEIKSEGKVNRVKASSLFEKRR